MSAAAQSLTERGSAEDSGEVFSFDALYAAHCDFVWRSLRRMGVQAAVVEDAMQDTFVILHRRLRDLHADASPRAFLFAIALRVARDYRRTLRRKGAQSLDTEAQVANDGDPFADAAKAEALRSLERFLGTLDEDKRAVFVLAELEQMSAPEISDALSVNINTVYSRLRLARERFFAFLTLSGR